MKTRILIILSLWGLIFLGDWLVDEFIIDPLEWDRYEYADEDNYTVSRFRSLEKEMFMELVDTLFVMKKIEFHKKEVLNFFRLDTVSYLEASAGTPNKYKVVGLPCYFYFNGDTLVAHSYLYFRPLKEDADYYLKNNKNSGRYYPVCF